MCVCMCVCVPSLRGNTTSVPLLPDKRILANYHQRRKDSFVIFSFLLCKKNSLSLPPLPSDGRDSRLLRKEEEPGQDPHQVCAGHNHCIRHPRKVQLRRQEREEAGAQGRRVSRTSSPGRCLGQQTRQHCGRFCY